ncbi:hypothetical protein GGR58DRAFT_475200 [Xylaria digitata]|nr:hypothetical protein GGR58DRAFT_475200 [Xylaria digitata]
MAKRWLGRWWQVEASTFFCTTVTGHRGNRTIACLMQCATSISSHRYSLGSFFFLGLYGPTSARYRRAMNSTAHTLSHTDHTF